MLQAEGSGSSLSNAKLCRDDLNPFDRNAHLGASGYGREKQSDQADAELVARAFQVLLTTSFSTRTQAEPPVPRPGRAKNRRRGAGGVDKSVLALAVARRIRDREHVKSVAKQACLVCGRRPADAHHLRFAQSPALGRKVSDEFTVPLCRGHHREVHRCGDEAVWWNEAGIDPTVTTRALWLEMHPLPAAPSAPTQPKENGASEPIQLTKTDT
jgi:hypothetical protein